MKICSWYISSSRIYIRVRHWLSIGQPGGLCIKSRCLNEDLNSVLNLDYEEIIKMNLFILKLDEDITKDFFYENLNKFEKNLESINFFNFK